SARRDTYRRPVLRVWRPSVLRPLVELARDGVQQLSGKAVRTGAIGRDAGVEVVVHDNGRDSGEQADTGGEQSFSDTRGNGGQVGRVGLNDTDEGVHDAVHGAEQTDERADGAGRSQEG